MASFATSTGIHWKSSDETLSTLSLKLQKTNRESSTEECHSVIIFLILKMTKSSTDNKFIKICIYSNRFITFTDRSIASIYEYFFSFLRRTMFVKSGAGSWKVGVHQGITSIYLVAYIIQDALSHFVAFY